MKSVILCALFMFSFSMFGVSQEATTVKTLSADEVKEGKNTGLYSFFYPEGTNADEINDVAQYYVQYFTVEYDANVLTATVKMLVNDETSRRIVARFLTASGMQHILVEGKSYTIQEFYDNFLAD